METLQHNKNPRFQELIICAIEQGYGLDLKPLYKYSVIVLGTYLIFRKILEAEIDDKTKKRKTKKG